MGSLVQAHLGAQGLGVFQSGQMGQTVNLLSTTSVVRIHLRPQPQSQYAKIAQLVEHDLAKVGVAGSSPVFRSSATSATIFEILHRYLMIYIVTTY